jgi:aryl-alcohol dehydrogenase-like predicted oxidoreductase
MKYIKLGADGVSFDIAKLVMGTDTIAQRLSDADFFRLLDYYTENGGNCIDTARVYSGGLSEEAVGRWFSSRGNRNGVVLSTKGCHPPVDNMPTSRLSRADMQYDLDLSLKALKTDHVDIYWLHRDDVDIPAGQIIEDINSFVTAGKIRLLGCSNWQTWRIEQANKYARAAGLQGFCTSQLQWSLGYTYEEVYDDYGNAFMDDEAYKWYLEKAMPVFAYGPQAQGFFAKLEKAGVYGVPTRILKRYYTPSNLKRLERAQEYAKKYGVPLSAAVLGYITCNRLPAAAIIGCKNIDQLIESLRAGDLDFGSDEADILYGTDR